MDLEYYLRLSGRIPGWTRGGEAEALAQASLTLPDGAVIVEVGAFFGCATVLLAGARRIRGSGRVHCVDPFDGSGDAVSVPHYQAILLAFAGSTQREHFDENLRIAGIFDWVEVHEGLADQIAANWSTPIDLLFLDGDQSPDGAWRAYQGWSPWLKPDGVIALHNSNEREYDEGHDGHRLLAVNEVVPPNYYEIRNVGSTTLGRKTGVNHSALRPRFP